MLMFFKSMTPITLAVYHTNRKVWVSRHADRRAPQTLSSEKPTHNFFKTRLRRFYLWGSSTANGTFPRNLFVSIIPSDSLYRRCGYSTRVWDKSSYWRECLEAIFFKKSHPFTIFCNDLWRKQYTYLRLHILFVHAATYCAGDHIYILVI